jgi:uncharacterized membrane protein
MAERVSIADELASVRDRTFADWIRRAVPLALWVVAILGTALLVRRRFDVALGSIPMRPPNNNIGDDFSVYFYAAKGIVSGHSPYITDYVYSPLVALVVAPFSHLSLVYVWRAFTALSIGAMVASAGVFVLSIRSRLHDWERPLLFGFCVLTILKFVPTIHELWNGQTDTFLLLVLVLSAVALSRQRPIASGVLAGVAGLIKSWPAASAIVFFRRGQRLRWHALTGWFVTLLIAPIMALAVGGISGFGQFFSSTFNARSQHLISVSVWGSPTLLFTRSGLARPILVSPELNIVASALLLIWVLGLGFVTLRSGADPTQCFWNLIFCAILLLPVSHLQYLVLAVPLLWIWVSEAVTKRPDGRRYLVVAVMIAWWFCLNMYWPTDGASAALSSVRYVVPFFVSLVAFTFSVLGGLASRQKVASALLNVSMPSIGPCH